MEQVLFDRMGVTVEQAVATGADFLDEKVAQAAQSGVAVDQRLDGLAGALEQLSRPETLKALGTLMEALPQLAQLAEVAQQLPQLIAGATDMLDAYQVRCQQNGIDPEKALLNGLNAVLFLGSQVDNDHLRRIGDLLASDILNRHAVEVVDNAAKSLTNAQQQVCQNSPKKIGLWSLLQAIRDPQIQRSLAFATEFGKCFGANLEQHEKK